MKNLIITDLKVLFRIPLNLFFSNIFPIFMSTILIVSFGNFSIGGNYHFVDKQFLIGLALAVPSIALVSFSVSVTAYVNNGILQRYYLSHVSIKKIMLSQILVHCLIGIIQFFVLTIYLTLFFNLHISNISNIFMLLISYIAVLLSTLSIGMVIGVLFKQGQVTLTASMAVMFIMYFCSGVLVQYEQLPESIKKISDWIPLKYLAQNSFSTFDGSQLVDSKLYLVSILSIVVFTIIAVLLLQKKYKRFN